MLHNHRRSMNASVNREQCYICPVDDAGVKQRIGKLTAESTKGRGREVRKSVHKNRSFNVFEDDVKNKIIVSNKFCKIFANPKYDTNFISKLIDKLRTYQPMIDSQNLIMPNTYLN